MSRKKKQHVVLGIGIDCPKCGNGTQTRQGTNHGKSFYFSQYDYCWRCSNVIFNEKYKVLATGQDAQRKFNVRIFHKQNRPPERTKTEREIAETKRAYGKWKSGLDELMKNL